MKVPTKTGRRRADGRPDFAVLFRRTESGTTQAELAREYRISPAAVSAGIARAARLDRLGLLGAGPEAIARAAEATGAPRATVAAFVAAAGRWTGPVAGVPRSPGFLRQIRTGHDWRTAAAGPDAVLAALRKACDAKPSASTPRLSASRADIVAALDGRARGRLDARGLACRLGLVGARAEEALRYASIAGVVLACDLALGFHPGSFGRAAELLDDVRASRALPDAEIARQLGTTRWQVAVARRAVEVLPEIRTALRDSR